MAYEGLQSSIPLSVCCIPEAPLLGLSRLSAPGPGAAGH